MNDILFKMLELSARGYCCSQIMLLLALDNLDRENPDLVRAMAGLCLGSGGGVCGVLPAAACLIALYAGKGEEQETENEKMALMLAELNDWFGEYASAKYTGIKCEEILGETPNHPDMSRCGELVADTYLKVMALLVSNGFDPSGGHCD